MDDNTTKVLMAVISLVSAVVTPLIVLYVSQKQTKKLAEVREKVDEYHKEVNGKMGLLLETTKDLATSQEKARAKAEDKNTKK